MSGQTQLYLIEVITHQWASSMRMIPYPSVKEALKTVRHLALFKTFHQYHIWQGDKMLGTWNAEGKRINVVQA